MGLRAPSQKYEATTLGREKGTVWPLASARGLRPGHLLQEDRKRKKKLTCGGKKTSRDSLDRMDPGASSCNDTRSGGGGEGGWWKKGERLQEGGEK